MPLIFVSYTEGTFTSSTLDQLCSQITRDGIELEGLPSNDYVSSTTWVWTQEYSKAKVYHGGKSGGAKLVTVDINVLQGGYSATTKSQLIKRVTDAVEKYGSLPSGEPRRVYVLVREVSESNWGFDGSVINLETLRRSDGSETPL